MKAIKQLAGETVIYGGSTILGRLLNYLLVILYTKIFEPAAYGVVTELMSYAGFFNVIYLYGMETGFFRFASREGMKKYFNICFTLILITSTLFTSILIVLATPIVKVLDYPGQEIWIYMMASIFMIDALSAMPFAKLRLKRKALKFAGLKIFGIILTILLNLIFLIVIPRGIEQGRLLFLAASFNSIPLVSYIFLANLIANTVMFLLLYIDIKEVRLQLESDTIQKLFRYSLPILLIGLAGMTNENLSRLLLKHLLPEGIHGAFSKQEALGIFGACYKLSIFMTLAVQAFRFASEPFFFSKAQDKDSPQLFSQVMGAFVIFGCLVVYFVSINVHWIAPLFLRNPAYLTGLSVVPILLTANLFLGIYYSLSVWYKLSDRTMYGAYIAIAGATVTVTLNIILIPKFGYNGSAVATLATYSSMCIFSYFLGKRFFPIPYQTRKILIYLVLTGLATYLTMVYVSYGVIATLVRNLIGIVTFVTVIALLERKVLLGLLNQRFGKQ